MEKQGRGLARGMGGWIDKTNNEQRRMKEWGVWLLFFFLSSGHSFVAAMFR